MKPTPLLIPLSWLYAAVVGLRNWFFDGEWYRITRVDVPVISVGNISAGGTGKTPFVEFLAKLLMEYGLRPAVLSRGYGRRSRGYQVVSNGRQRCAEAATAGDEPAQMAEKLTGAVIAVDEKRVRGAEILIREFRPDLVVLDDGFQHRALARDLDVVLVTAEECIRGSLMLPAGFRREPWSSLKRAHLVVITKCASFEQFEEAARAVNRRVRKPLIGTRIKVLGMHRIGSPHKIPQAHLSAAGVLAVSGIAQPRTFESVLNALGCRLVGHVAFPDHHPYARADLSRLAEEFRTSGATLLVTTEKDEVRLREAEGFEEFVKRVACGVLEIGIEVIAGADVLMGILESIVRKGKR